MDKQSILKTLLKTALLGVLPVVLLVLLKIGIGNQFEGYQTIPLLWLLVNTLPLLCCLCYLLFSAAKQDRFYISTHQYQIAGYLLWAYLGLLFVSLLLPNMGQNIPEAEQCLACATLRLSYYWLLPMQAILIGILVLPLLQRKEAANVLLSDIADDVTTNTALNINIPSHLRKKKVNVFLSYSEADTRFMQQLDKHLAVFKRNEIIATWHDQKILAGSELAKSIVEQLEQADLILLLISVDFIADDHLYYQQLAPAFVRHQAQKAIVIPILLRPCEWQSDIHIGTLAALPSNQKPVTDKTWASQDAAFDDIVQSLKGVLKVIYQP
jgi:hypothetical protein